MDWFPFVSLQIQLNFFFRDLVFSCQDLVKISQELNQFFINLLLERQKLETVVDRTPLNCPWSFKMENPFILMVKSRTGMFLYLLLTMGNAVK